jgi:O-antigen/teichoic acid export membrane protein
MVLLRAGAIAFGGKILQLSLGTVAVLLLPALMPASAVGTYFLAQVAIAVGAVLAQAGLTLIAPVYVGEALVRRDLAGAAGFCRAALLLCLVASMVVCAAGLLLAWATPADILASLGFESSVVWAIVAIIPFAALCAVLAEMHRASSDIAMASLLPNGQGAGVALFASFALAFVFHPYVGQFLLAGLAGLFLATSVAFFTLQRRLDMLSAVQAPRLPELAASALPALVTSVAALIVSLSDQTIAGFVGGPVEAAHYGLGLRLSALLTLPLAIVNATIMPQIVALWARGRKRRLQHLLTTSAAVASFCAALGLAGLAAFAALGPQPIWDASFAPALTVAVILGSGQVIHTLGGSSGYLLLLLGYQAAFMRLSLTAGTLAIALAVPAMSWGGIVGLATVMAFANAIQTIAGVFLARRLLGLNSWTRPVSPRRLWGRVFGRDMDRRA